MVSHHRCVPKSRDKLKIIVRILGWVVWAHFRSQYPMPLGPSADESAAMLRVAVTSSLEIGGHWHVGRGLGSPSCRVAT